MPTDNAIAVVGLACRYPGAADAAAFWAALCAGTEGISRWTPEELVAAGADPTVVKRPDFVPARGLVPGARNFDWTMFGYSRADAAGIDPQQRVFLECAASACDDAGLDPARFPGLIGVYGGVDWVATHAVNPALTQLIGQDKDFATSRVAYKLGLRGPAITVQTACSTSLTAVHMAVQSLLGYECDAALAGGASIGAADDRGYIYQEGGILSPDGHCRPFDQHAAGTVPSEGVGVVVLKRLQDALADGDRIAAVVLGSAVNNDGGDKVGYSAPAIPGQRDVILFAQKAAAIDPADLGHVEAHGTGTRIGDPVEIRALTDVFRMSTDATGSCWLGAVKSNIGHTGAASGVAGLIKSVLMLEHGELVPTLHYTAPNPLLDIDTTPFRVCTEHRPWPEDRPRLAAASSFGVGGTNAHVVLSGPPSRRRPTPRGGARLLALSAGSPGALDRYGAALAEHLDAAPDPSLPAVSRTLAGRRRLGARRSVVAADPAEAARLLRTPADPGHPGPFDRVAFLFPGQGTLRGPAGAAAYRLLGGFRESFDEIRDAIRQEYAVDLAPVVTEGGAPAEWFADTVHQQLGLFALGCALGRQLGDWGVTPLAMLGNSIGEYAAATLAGVWTPAEAAALVCERAGAMRATEPGRMAAVAAPAEEVSQRIDPDADVEIAVVGPERVVVSGGTEAVQELLTDGSLDGLETRLLPNRRAFHSVRMEPAAEKLLDVVGDVPNRRAQLPLVSNVTGDWADPDAVRDPAYWSEQVRQPVQLDDALGTVLAAGCDTFLELGPGTSMLGSIRRHRDWVAGHRTVPLLGGADEDAELGLLRALGLLWERGLDIDLDAVQETQAPLRCALPALPFDSRDPDLVPAPEPVPDDGRAVDPLRAVLARLWCEALGVASARDEDDFFALGGESLMAVHLVARVREHAATVSVADFTREPTFGRLLEMAASAASGPVPGVEVLSPGGRGTPLFLAADALGTALTYQLLADRLGTDRPVYGLQPVATPGTERATRIERTAAQHVDALTRIQPVGPYVVGGWSYGAVVAHAMAHELTRRGERVEALICLDGTVTPGRRPLGLHPLHLGRNVRLQLDAALGRGPVGDLVGQAPGLRRLFIANVGAALRYRSVPVPCPAYVFPAGPEGPAAARLRRALARCYERVEVLPAAGDHWSMLTEPHVRALAEQVRQVLPAEGTGRG